ncbi:MAG: histidine ammonia-lyase [Candidatus Thermoplasmatota archaeon]|jgi:histidine ammonia-lyase|nr:histidine ammonia-lyase [Candidatus Thermoplasmatota archaeon]MCL5793683.1 histidine ammonia-lyase [Candidatus Thermoplasmatota archaeon]
MVDLDGESLTIDQVVGVSSRLEEVRIRGKTWESVLRSRKTVDEIINSGKTAYGINTGFGSLLNVKIDRNQAVILQENLIRSHASGIGNPLSQEHVRAIMLVRLNSLVRGFSGVSREVVESLVVALNQGLFPEVPEYGSVGASGDLAPLAHIALALMGEGKFFVNGSTVPASEVLASAGIRPLKLKEKDGVAFINGTSAISGILSVELGRAARLLEEGIASAAMSMEALKATLRAFSDQAIATRKHQGQRVVARIVRDVLSGSRNIEKHTASKVQDPYTIRCMPQVYGAVLDTVNYSSLVLADEINSTTDNPIVVDDDVISAGNFHGEPVAFVCDFLAIALTDLGNMIERRIARMVDEKLSGLPPFLTSDSGLNSGLMIPQYTAAALCNMNKVLCFPSSADNIPTSANQEDHVSMGMTSALKLSKIVENLERIIAIEFLVANQGLYFIEDEISPRIRDLSGMIRMLVPKIEADRPFSIDMDNIIRIMRSEDFRDAVKTAGANLVPW